MYIYINKRTLLEYISLYLDALCSTQCRCHKGYVWPRFQSNIRIARSVCARIPNSTWPALTSNFGYKKANVLVLLDQCIDPPTNLIFISNSQTSFGKSLSSLCENVFHVFRVYMYTCNLLDSGNKSVKFLVPVFRSNTCGINMIIHWRRNIDVNSKLLSFRVKLKCNLVIA